MAEWQNIVKKETHIFSFSKGNSVTNCDLQRQKNDEFRRERNIAS